MDKLNFGPLGGVELHQDDLEFWDNAIREALATLGNAISPSFRVGGQILILSGNATWSAGRLWVNNESFVLDAGSAIVPTGHQTYYALQETFDPGGNELNEPGSTIQTYIKRKATVRTSLSPIGESDFLSDSNIGSPGLFTLGNNWQSLTLRPGFSNKLDHDLKWSRDSNRWVSLHGTVSVTTAAQGGGIVATIPSTVKPPVGIVRRFSGTNNRGVHLAIEVHGADGTLRVVTADEPYSPGGVSVGDLISFDGVRWYDGIV